MHRAAKMLKHPISAFFRLFPTLGWLAACAVALWVPATLYLNLQARGRWTDLGKAWPDALMLLGFVAVAIYAARMAHKEYKEELPALRADKPIRLGPLLPRRRPPPFTPTRYPLSETLRTELRKLIETLEGAGMLQPAEVAVDEVIDRAETLDEWSQVDLFMAMYVLDALHFERQRPFANIAFLPADAETDPSDVVKIVHELARLCGRSHELGAVRVRWIAEREIVPTPGGSPTPPNAVAEFELGGEHHTVPFVLHRKYFPDGLVPGLAKLLVAADDPRQFVWDFFDSFFGVSYLTPAQTSAVNGAEQQEFPRFEAVR
jgi:hypothetical protein